MKAKLIFDKMEGTFNSTYWRYRAYLRIDTPMNSREWQVWTPEGMEKYEALLNLCAETLGMNPEHRHMNESDQYVDPASIVAINHRVFFKQTGGKFSPLPDFEELTLQLENEKVTGDEEHWRYRAELISNRSMFTQEWHGEAGQEAYDQLLQKTSEVIDRGLYAYYRGPGLPYCHMATVWALGKRVVVTQSGGLDI